MFRPYRKPEGPAEAWPRARRRYRDSDPMSPEHRNVAILILLMGLTMVAAWLNDLTSPILHLSIVVLAAMASATVDLVGIPRRTPPGPAWIEAVPPQLPPTTTGSARRGATLARLPRKGDLARAPEPAPLEARRDLSKYRLPGSDFRMERGGGPRFEPASARQASQQVGRPRIDRRYRLSAEDLGLVREVLDDDEAERCLVELDMLVEDSPLRLGLEGDDFVVACEAYPWLHRQELLLERADFLANRLTNVLLTRRLSGGPLAAARARRADEARDAAAAIRQDAGEGGLELVGDAAASAEATCGVCGEEVASERVCCARCDTPHHRSCFEWNGGCTVYACAGTEARG